MQRVGYFTMNELKNYSMEEHIKNDGEPSLIQIVLLQKILIELQKLNAK